MAGGACLPRWPLMGLLNLDRDGERSLPEQERRGRRVRIADVGQEHAKRGAAPWSLLHPGATAVHPGKADH